MTHSTHQRIVVAVLGMMLCLAGCERQTIPTATTVPATPAATATPTATATATATAPPPTATPTARPSPTPVLGLALTADDLPAVAAALNVGPLDWELISEVGALRRLEAASPADGLTLVTIARGAELLCLEARLDVFRATEATAEAVLLALVDAALPQWSARAAWLRQSLDAVIAGELVGSANATSQVRVTLRQNEGANEPLVLMLSTLWCDGEQAAGGFEPFDPTLGLGFGRQALQWAFEGLMAERRLSFTRSTDRMAQPVVVGRSSDSLATLTLVGPEEQLVFANLSLAVPVGSGQAEASAVALGQLLARVALPAWPDGEQWMSTAIRSALQGARLEQRRSGIQLLVQQDPASDRLVDITLAAIRQTLPPVSMTPTPAPVVTTVSIVGLPAEELACLTVVFWRDGEQIERLPAPPDGLLLGPEADEVLLEGSPDGSCPWQNYWTPNSRLPVEAGRADFVFTLAGN